MQLDHTWREIAECRDCNSDIFFPDGPNLQPDERNRYERAAKAICDVCEVRQHCLDVALQFHEPYGIWGGKTEDERRNILRKRKARLDATAT